MLVFYCCHSATVLTTHSVCAQVLYVVEDPARPAPPALKAQNDAELAFMEQYFNRTGVQWRHYYGPQGPRPPPVLHMWPAAQVGAVHRVVSPEGYW